MFLILVPETIEKHILLHIIDLYHELGAEAFWHHIYQALKAKETSGQTDFDASLKSGQQQESTSGDKNESDRIFALLDSF